MEKPNLSLFTVLSVSHVNAHVWNVHYRTHTGHEDCECVHAMDNLEAYNIAVKNINEQLK
jgi:hypothetical protein